MDLRDSGESDCDFEALQVIVLRRKRKIKERPDFFHYYDDVDFRERFLMCKGAAWLVFSLMKDKIYLEARNNAMQPHQIFFIALRFYAPGSFQQIVAALSGVSKASASRAITLVSYHLVSLRPDFVKFPQTKQERLETQAAFKERANFPRVIGAMDCTHVKINSPGTASKGFEDFITALDFRDNCGCVLTKMLHLRRRSNLCAMEVAAKRYIKTLLMRSLVKIG
ncbi:putative nuclease HARBI1 isoform X1 [Eurosta solidaginis]|uniref:putative nuclease HARBI1 isoform X1 n=1 Tax=Eurosta solidaginis TaxID=178769 RepID=UPI0035315A45